MVINFYEPEQNGAKAEVKTVTLDNADLPFETPSSLSGSSIIMKIFLMKIFLTMKEMVPS